MPATGDFFPHHLDANGARRRTSSAPRAMSTGYGRVRFVRPVFIVDTIRAETTIKEKRDHPKRASHGVVVGLLEASNQAGETVLVCERLYLVERREAAPTCPEPIEGRFCGRGAAERGEIFFAASPYPLTAPNVRPRAR
jgi:acyl dehydratase